MLAQTGLPDPTGGTLFLLAGAVAGALGLTLCVMGVLRLVLPRRSRRTGWLLAAAGLMLASPAIWLAFMLVASR